MNNKIAIVTGATSGFGLLTALKLAGTHFVIATARHPEKAEALRNRIAELSIDSSIAVTELDVTNEQSISTFTEELKPYGQIDVLVNNAGTAYGGFT